MNGNFYVIRASEPSVAFVLSGSGECVRKLEIKSPEAGMRLVAAHVSGGKLAALLARTATDGEILKEVMVIVDTSIANAIRE